MRKTVDRFSDIKSFHKRLILVFEIQNGWDEVIFQLIHLIRLWHYSLMNVVFQFCNHTILGINTPTPANKEYSTGIKMISTKTRQVIQQQHPQNKGDHRAVFRNRVGMTLKLRQLLLWSLLLNSLWSRKLCPCKFSFLFSSKSLLSLNIFIKPIWRDYLTDTC